MIHKWYFREHLAPLFRRNNQWLKVHGMDMGGGHTGGNWLKRSAVPIGIAAFGVAIAILGWAAWTIMSFEPAPVIEQASSPAEFDTEPSAEDKANEVLTKIIIERGDDSSQPVERPTAQSVQSNHERSRRTPEVRPTHDIPAPSIRLNCERLEKAYSSEQLQDIPAYKEVCL